MINGQQNEEEAVAKMAADINGAIEEYNLLNN